MIKTTMIFSSAIAFLGINSVALADQLQRSDRYPDRPVTIISPYGTGGGSDIMVRSLSAPLSEELGVEVRVVNQPGGGGFVAIPDYMSRPADGYTLFQHVNSIIEGEVLGRVNFDTLENLTPICTTTLAYSQLYISPDESRFRDWNSFVEYAKANPGQVTIGNVNTEMAQIQLLSEMAGIEVEQINFSNPSERYASIIGGHADVLYEQPGDVASFLEAGQITPILTFIKGDAPEDYANVPTLNDVGLNDLEVIFLTRMLFVHSAAPAERIAFLEDACERAYNSDEFKKYLVTSNMDVGNSYLNSEDSRALLEEQKAAFQEIHAN